MHLRIRKKPEKDHRVFKDRTYWHGLGSGIAVSGLSCILSILNLHAVSIELDFSDFLDYNRLEIN